MFTTEAREELRDRVVEMARKDQRVVAAAEVGSLALGEGDRLSDIDLSFAVDDAVGLAEILGDWSSTLSEELGGVALFDLTVGPTVYRVFMFADCLQLDVSFTSAREFAPSSPKFHLIFGAAGEMREAEPPGSAGLLGWALMWARHARVCMERGRLRQAEHAIFRMRESALDFACRRRDLPTGYGRGLEQLPPNVHDRFAVVASFEPDALKEALKTCVAGLSAECAEEGEIDQVMCERLSETIGDL